MRHDRLRALLPLALLNIFVLVAGLIVRDIIVSRPPDPSPHPPAHAEEVAGRADLGADPVDPDRLARLLDDRMSDSGIDEGLAAYVVDARTGEALYARDEDDAAVPASTTKLVTAVSALHELGPDERIATTVVRGDQADEITLVGGGDPTLTEALDEGAYPRRATLEELAEDTAAALDEAGVDTVHLNYDDSYYTGPAAGPGWKPNYVTEGSVAPVHALMIDGGRIDPALPYGPRADDPPLAAAEAFADRLEAAGITVNGGPAEAAEGSGEAPDPGDVLATALSAPISALVEIMLTESENNVGEALVFQIAAARGGEPSFADAGPAVGEVVSELGIDGIHVEDGSGLSVNNRITSAALVDLLLLAGEPDRPELRSTLTGLPVAHFSGTLTDRYSPASTASDGAGRVRAKTGTLDGVSTLAGVASDENGRDLAFAFMANDPMAAGPTLDRLASALAECRC